MFFNQSDCLSTYQRKQKFPHFQDYHPGFYFPELELQQEEACTDELCCLPFLSSFKEWQNLLQCLSITLQWNMLIIQSLHVWCYFSDSWNAIEIRCQFWLSFYTFPMLPGFSHLKMLSPLRMSPEIANNLRMSPLECLFPLWRTTSGDNIRGLRQGAR